MVSYKILTAFCAPFVPPCAVTFAAVGKKFVQHALAKKIILFLCLIYVITSPFSLFLFLCHDTLSYILNLNIHHASLKMSQGGTPEK